LPQLNEPDGQNGRPSEKYEPPAVERCGQQIAVGRNGGWVAALCLRKGQPLRVQPSSYDFRAMLLAEITEIRFVDDLFPAGALRFPTFSEPGGTYTRWISSRGFTVSSSVPLLPSFTQRDFHRVPLTFGVLSCFFVIDHDRRKILHLHVTGNPNAHWPALQMRQTWGYHQPQRFLIFDRDAKFNADVVATVKAMGSERCARPSAVRGRMASPNAGWEVFGETYWTTSWL
jgi:hypothetical protein